MSSQHDDRHRRKFRADECDKVLSVGLWQINVADDGMDWETGGIGLDRGNRFIAISGFKHFVATLFQGKADCFSDMLFVINNKHSPLYYTHHHIRPLRIHCEMIAHTEVCRVCAQGVRTLCLDDVLLYLPLDYPLK